MNGKTILLGKGSFGAKEGLRYLKKFGLYKKVKLSEDFWICGGLVQGGVSERRCSFSSSQRFFMFVKNFNFIGTNFR